MIDDNFVSENLETLHFSLDQSNAANYIKITSSKMAEEKSYSNK